MKMNTPWVYFKQFGCYYKLTDSALLAMPANAKDLDCNTQESCDVDWFGIDAETKLQCKIAMEDLIEMWLESYSG